MEHYDVEPLCADEKTELRALALQASPGPWSACGVDPMERGSVDPENNIVQPRKHKNGACSCGFVWSTPLDLPVLEVTGGEWGDTWPSIRTRGDGALEAYMESSCYGEVSRERQAANMKFLAKAHPQAIIALLDEISRLRSRAREILQERMVG